LKQATAKNRHLREGLSSADCEKIITAAVTTLFGADSAAIGMDFRHGKST